MERLLTTYRDEIWAIARVVVGFLFACHGAQKLFGVLGGVDGEGGRAALLSMFGAAGLIELVAGGLVALGLYARPAAFIASGEMAVAYFMVHFPRGFWPIQNDGELAALYAFVFLYVAARGAGRWSLGGASADRARRVGASPLARSGIDHEAVPDPEEAVPAQGVHRPPPSIR